MLVSTTTSSYPMVSSVSCEDRLYYVLGVVKVLSKQTTSDVLSKTKHTMMK